MFIMEKRRLREDFITVYDSLPRGCRQVRVELFPQGTVKVQEDTDLQMHKWMIRLDAKRYSLQKR